MSLRALCSAAWPIAERDHVRLKGGAAPKPVALARAVHLDSAEVGGVFWHLWRAKRNTSFSNCATVKAKASGRMTCSLSPIQSPEKAFLEGCRPRRQRR